MSIQFKIYSKEINDSYYNNITYVFCSNKNFDAKWLIENDENVTVEGEWIHYNYNIRENKYISSAYFKLSDGINKLNELKIKCISKFGGEYKYAQPVSRLFNNWYLFGIENGVVFDGIFTIVKKYISCPYKFSLEKDEQYIMDGFFNLKSYILDID